MKKYLISIVMIILCVILVMPNSTYAGDINTDEFSDIYSSTGTSKVTTAGGKILGVVQVIGVSVGVICLIIMGIKYTISSTDDKATIKEKLIPYVIGAVIMFGGTGILTLVANYAQDMEQPGTHVNTSKTCTYCGTKVSIETTKCPTCHVVF